MEFLAGALLLTWVFVDSRHLRNYAYVWFLRRRPESIKGRSEYSYWLTQKMLSSEAFTFSLFYLFLALLTWRFSFWPVCLPASLSPCAITVLQIENCRRRRRPRPKITVH